MKIWLKVKFYHFFSDLEKSSDSEKEKLRTEKNDFAENTENENPWKLLCKCTKL